MAAEVLEGATGPHCSSVQAVQAGQVSSSPGSSRRQQLPQQHTFG